MKMLRVFLANRGNIDHNQDPTKSLYGTWTDYFETVHDEQHASEMVRKYIEKYDLGGGNFVGGQIVTPEDEMIAYVSYNGRVWGKDSKYFAEEKARYERNYAAN